MYPSATTGNKARSEGLQSHTERLLSVAVEIGRGTHTKMVSRKSEMSHEPYVDSIEGVGAMGELSS